MAELLDCASICTCVAVSTKPWIRRTVANSDSPLWKQRQAPGSAGAPGMRIDRLVNQKADDLVVWLRAHDLFDRPSLDTSNSMGKLLNSPIHDQAGLSGHGCAGTGPSLPAR